MYTSRASELQKEYLIPEPLTEQMPHWKDGYFEYSNLKCKFANKAGHNTDQIIGHQFTKQWLNFDALASPIRVTGGSYEVFPSMNFETHDTDQSDIHERDTLLAAIRQRPGSETIFSSTYPWHVCEAINYSDETILEEGGDLTVENSVEWHQALGEGAALLAAMQIVDRGSPRTCCRKVKEAQISSNLG